MISDAELLGRYVAQGSEEAFAELVHRHLGNVYSSAFRRVGGDCHLARDVAQRVFIALATKARHLTKHPHLGGWLYTAARNEAANLVRSERRRKHREGEVILMTESESSDAGVWAKIAPSIDDLIDGLTESERQVVLLRFMEKKTHREIAELLGISEDAARMRVERSLDRLRGQLSRKGIESTSAALGLVLIDHSIASVPVGTAATVTSAALGAGSASLAVVGTGSVLGGILLWQTVGAAAIFFGALAAAGYEAWQMHREEVSLVAREDDYGRSKARVDAQWKFLLAERKAFAISQKHTSSNVLAHSSSIPPEIQASIDAGNALAARHPEVRQATAAYFKAKTHPRYAGLYRQLGLQPDQIERFEAIMLNVGGWGTTLPDGTQVLVRSMADPVLSGVESQLHEFLGDANFQAFKAYGNSLAARDIASNLASIAADNGSPLTPDQAGAIASIFTSERVKRTAQDFHWDEAVAKAQTVLTSAQLDLLQLMEAKSQVAQRNAVNVSVK